MTGAIFIFDIAVVFGALVDVFDNQPNGRTCGDAFKNAGQDFHRIGFLALGCVFGLPRTAFIQIDLNISFG